MGATAGAPGHTRGVAATSSPEPRPAPSAGSDPARLVEAVIAARRTNLRIDPARPVPADLVDRLITSATWAPNHKRTWPWRFTVLTGDARLRLGTALAEAAAARGVDEAKVAKLRGKYARSAVVVLVWQVVDGDEVRRREDRDAVAAATQNLLLAATAHGLASYWGSIAGHLVPAAREVAGVDADHDPVALVYLGWPTGEVAVPARPVPVVRHLDR